jgi:hypothetical protein
MSDHSSTALYFIASPLHYLAAKTVASSFEKGSRQILVYMKPDILEPIIEDGFWDETVYMPWPRHDPLPGPLGRMRRIRENLHTIATLLPKEGSLSVHAHEYDNEAINYFISFLSNRFEDVKFRIIPDGAMNLSRHPLPLWKTIWQCLRKTRALLMPELNYQCYTGDRLGTDASFIDRIYTLPGFTHQYDPQKCVELPPLESHYGIESTHTPKALIIGEYFLGSRRMKEEDVLFIKNHIKDWLTKQNVKDVYFKPHPRDSKMEFFDSSYKILAIDEPLESHMLHTYYDYVISVDSTALFLARIIYPKETKVLSFDVNRAKFPNPEVKKRLVDFMKHLGIERIEGEAS